MVSGEGGFGGVIFVQGGQASHITREAASCMTEAVGFMRPETHNKAGQWVGYICLLFINVVVSGLFNVMLPGNA